MSKACNPHRRWMPIVLRLAAAYHLILFAAIWTPFGEQAITGLDASHSPFAAEFWRAHSIGSSFGLGVGLFLASFSPLRQWSVVGVSAAVCAMMLASAATHMLFLPWWHITFGYAIWLIPLFIMLHDAWTDFIGRQRVACPEIQRIAMRTRTSLDVTLDELSRLSPVMVVFLRHLGCPFCREALADLALERARIEREGTRLLLVHMAEEDELLTRMAPTLLDVARLHDPNQVVYRAFGLGRGRFLDVFGPAVWLRGFQTGFRRGFGRVNKDIFQMPGVFMVYHGQVIRSFRHRSIADRPNYLAIASQPEYQGS